MTAITASIRSGRRTTAWLPVARALAARSLVGTWRVPAAILPLLLMPVFFVVAFSGSFSALTNLPAFPTDNVVSWMMPFAIVQGAAFSGMGTAFGTVRDIESGFYDRLLLAPGSRAGVLVSPVFAGVVRCTLTTAVVAAFGFALGADLPGGVLGLLPLWVAAVGVAIVSIGWALGVVYRMPSMRAASLVQVGIFAGMFLSTGNVPIDAQTGWVQGVARVNPVTDILTLARQGLLGEVAWSSTWPGLIAIAGSAVVLWVFAVRGIRHLIP